MREGWEQRGLAGKARPALCAYFKTLVEAGRDIATFLLFKVRHWVVKVEMIVRW